MVKSGIQSDNLTDEQLREGGGFSENEQATYKGGSVDSGVK